MDALYMPRHMSTVTRRPHSCWWKSPAVGEWAFPQKESPIDTMGVTMWPFKTVFVSLTTLLGLPRYLVVNTDLCQSKHAAEPGTAPAALHGYSVVKPRACCALSKTRSLLLGPGVAWSSNPAQPDLRHKLRSCLTAQLLLTH